MLFRWPLATAAVWIGAGIYFLIVGPWEIAAVLGIMATIAIWQANKNRTTNTTWPQRRAAGRQIRIALNAHPELTFDETGIHYRIDDLHRFLAWNDISKIEACSVKLFPMRRELVLIFTADDGRTPGFIYNETPLDMLQEMQRLPGFDVYTAMAPLGSIRINTRVTCWERPSTKPKRQSGATA
jgi:hypothetical protein